MARERDDFKKPVIEALSRRVAQRCSNPECRVPTAAPSDTELGVNNIGIAAHIHAASPGGPRYDLSMTSDERASIKNGIWLCSNCANQIDRDVNLFSAEKLKGWKARAEKTALKEHGKKLPSESDAVDLTSMILQGHPQRFLPNAIANVHKATSLALSEIDPRFEIETRYQDGETIFEYKAKEDFSFDLKIAGENNVQSFKRFIEDGEDLEIPSKFVDTDGLIFSDALSKEKGVLKIIRNGRNAVQKLWLVNPKTNVIEQFDDVHGKVVTGTKSIKYEGSACAGLFCMSYSQPITKEKFSSDFTLTLNFEIWEGKQLKSLPYLNKIKKFFEKLSLGWELHAALEYNGEKVFETKAANTKECDYFKEMTNHIGYISDCSSIAKFVDSDVAYKVGVYCDYEDVKHVRDVADVLRGNAFYTESDTIKNATFSVILEDRKALKKMTESEKPMEIYYVESGETVNFFGQEVDLPDKTVNIKSTFIKPLDDIDKAKIGDELKFECIPSDDYELTISYE